MTGDQNSKWKIVKLNDLGFVGRGKSRHRPRNDVALYGGRYPFIQTAEIMASDLYVASYTQTYSEFGLSQSKLWDEDTLCMTIAGENTGEVAILSFKACFPDSIVGFVADPAKADVRFIKYLFDPMKRELKNVSRGATQDNLSLDKLLSFDLRIPPLRTQKAIADILASYDDLIENNTRRIQILEQMAQMLYREWFVNFRFPDHEKAKLVESENGLIPNGWEVESLKDIALFFGRGISPTYDDAVEGLVINQKCVREGKLNLAPARHQSKKAPQEKMVREGDVLINSTGVGTLGRVAQVLEPIANCTVDSHVSIVRPKKNAEFFGKALLALEDHFASQGVGATGQTELSRERIAATRIVIPPPSLQEPFCRVVAPMNKMLVCCLRRNENLRQTRDLLLPKLVYSAIRNWLGHVITT